MTPDAPTPDLQQVSEGQDALEAYLADIARRRQQRREARERRAFWEAAARRVEVERRDAEADGDGDIAAELAAVAAHFRALLGDRSEADAAPAAVTAPPDEEPAPPFEGLSVQPVELARGMPPDEEPDLPAEGESPDDTPPISAEARLPEPTEEQRTRLAAIRGEWEALQAEGFAAPDGTPHRPRLLLLRALVCELGAVHYAMQAEDAPLQTHPDVRGLLAVIEHERKRAKDFWPGLPFDRACWTDEERARDAEQWERLAPRYRRMARAAEALQWYQENEAALRPEAQTRLLNTAAAAQQDLWRELDEQKGIERERCVDKLQETFFPLMRDRARTLGYLDGLSRDTDEERIESLAEGLEAAWDAARHEAVYTPPPRPAARETPEQQEESARRQRAVAAVRTLCESREDFGEDPELAEADAAQLLPLLKECADAGVRPVNVGLLAALVRASLLLPAMSEPHPRLAEEVRRKRQTHGLEAAPQGEPGEEASLTKETLADREAARAVTRGKRVLLLGGISKHHTCEKLKEALECASVDWPETDKNDVFNKFEGPVRNADVVLVAIRFAGHEMTYMSRDWLKEGGHLIQLPGGYGVNQIVFRIAEYARRGRLARAPAEA